MRTEGGQGSCPLSLTAGDIAAEHGIATSFTPAGTWTWRDERGSLVRTRRPRLALRSGATARDPGGSRRLNGVA
jgi:hypothetical protein